MRKTYLQKLDLNLIKMICQTPGTKNISISFDIAGEYLLPQKEQFKVLMKVDKPSSISIINKDLKDLSYIEKLILLL